MSWKKNALSCRLAKSRFYHSPPLKDTTDCYYLPMESQRSRSGKNPLNMHLFWYRRQEIQWCFSWDRKMELKSFKYSASFLQCVTEPSNETIREMIFTKAFCVWFQIGSEFTFWQVRHLCPWWYFPGSMPYWFYKLLKLSCSVCERGLILV